MQTSVLSPLPSMTRESVASSAVAEGDAVSAHSGAGTYPARTHSWWLYEPAHVPNTPGLLCTVNKSPKSNHNSPVTCKWVKSVPPYRADQGRQKETSEPSLSQPPFRDVSKTGTMNVPTSHFFWKQPLTPFLERVNRPTGAA